ncbi:sulfatase-like hydrolase/transferase [Dyadobacter sp. CY323]|uniref:sulfatase-like hydrolase/transferase n=1 Tax=Dyadobacter sp. CY323 TaxID=2907302 RepID=UPI001F38D80B|nr:sulfatase-like hydrolase/transferase [Dyadobacter sp. CY323]MCE6991166.1 sulfatase-like hydrolase/transferase [Dyadobacter sp. CY323]
MLRKLKWRTSIILIGFIAILQNQALSQTGQSVSSKHPNVVFIIADSHRGEALGINGHPFVQTPHLDELARGGIRFTSAYVTTAICSVSRASILSGQHRARHKINDFTTTFSDEAMQQTYPMVLKKAGYKTAQIGFLGVGKTPLTKYFDVWDVQIPWMTKEGLHQTDNVTKKALEYLDQQKTDQPFYLALSFTAAHEVDGQNGNPATYMVQERFKDLYKDLKMPVPTTAAPEYWNSFPDFFRNDKNIGRGRWNGLFSTPELYQENVKNYYRLVTGVDEAVGKVMEKIKALKLDENTIVIYTSDHGFSLGEHGMMGKWYGFEKGIHVPLIFNDLRPAAKWHNVKSDQLVLNIDIAPTILTMAGFPVPAVMQGVDLLQVMQKKQPVRTHFFYEHTVFASPMLHKVEGLVSKDYKYFNYTEHNFESFYDTRKDPEETKDVARDKKYQKKLAAVKALYEKEKRAIQ